MPTEKMAASLGSASEMDLRYGYFETDVKITAEGMAEALPGITLLDFVFCLLRAADAVMHGKTGRAGFTEDDTSITFHPEGSDVMILRSWDPAPGRCMTDEFISGVRLFVVTGLELIVGKYPVFAENPAYHKLLAMGAGLELPPSGSAR
ncbi:hypothetical protein ACFYNO_03180 [Kitasatospora sp. NPDC006697]|uniref:hypothetical protein n=1 Tax=Kitasatospora sp. NPDC006697 TaxID=3364020 RepID=UPI0036C77B92